MSVAATPGGLAVDARHRAWGLLLACAYAAVAVVGMARGEPDVVAILATVTLGSGLVALSVVDIASYRLPDALTAALAVAGFAFGWAMGWPLPWQIASAVLGYALLWAVAHAYRAIRGRDGMGLGDAKLLGVAGAWLGAEALPTVLLAAAVSALAWVLVRALATKDLDAGRPIAFGPFLAAGIWLAWTHGSV